MIPTHSHITQTLFDGIFEQTLLFSARIVRGHLQLQNEPFSRKVLAICIEK